MKSEKNKMINSTLKRPYSFPRTQTPIMARSLEEAQKEYKKLLKNNLNKDG